MISIISSIFIDHGVEGKPCKSKDSISSMPITILKLIIYESEIERLHIKIESFFEEKILFTGSLSFIKQQYSHPDFAVHSENLLSQSWAFDVSTYPI